MSKRVVTKVCEFWGFCDFCDFDTKVCEFWGGELWRREGLEPVGGEEAKGKERISVFYVRKYEKKERISILYVLYVYYMYIFYMSEYVCIYQYISTVYTCFRQKIKSELRAEVSNFIIKYLVFVCCCFQVFHLGFSMKDKLAKEI